jgi:hypothetical protein
MVKAICSRSRIALSHALSSRGSRSGKIAPPLPLPRKLRLDEDAPFGPSSRAIMRYPESVQFTGALDTHVLTRSGVFFVVTVAGFDHALERLLANPPVGFDHI